MFGSNSGISIKFQDQKINIAQIIDQDDVTRPLPWENQQNCKAKAQ